MTCRVYTISVDSRALTKITNTTAYTELTTINGKDRIDIISPTFIFNYSSTLLAANYLYCSDFGRYYFITNIAVDTAGRIVINCAVDVLQTYATEIKNCYGVIIRAESKGAPTMYVDNKLPIYTDKKTATSIIMPETGGNFTANGNNYCYVLNVIGSGA